MFEPIDCTESLICADVQQLSARRTVEEVVDPVRSLLGGLQNVEITMWHDAKLRDPGQNVPSLERITNHFTAATPAVCPPLLLHRAVRA